MIAAGPPTCLMFQSRYPGSEFSLTGPRWDGAGEAPDFFVLPVPGRWHPAVTAGIAAAPAAIPIKARREGRAGEPMRPIMHEAVRKSGQTPLNSAGNWSNLGQQCINSLATGA